jgi:hypothetical protein
VKRRLLTAGLLALLMSATGPLTGGRAAAQEDLAGVLATLAAMWARGDAAALAAFGARHGIELELQGEPLGRVSGRKAAAALRHIFATQETVSVLPSRTSRVTGTDHTAFGELTWVVRPRGSAMPQRTTVFLGLVREGQSWRVSQIRVLR